MNHKKLIQLVKMSTFLILPGTLITGCIGNWDTIVNNKYQNYEEIIEHAGIERGWIPKFIPTSAVNINEKHDLDTNEIILKFNFDVNESTDLKQNCQAF